MIEDSPIHGDYGHVCWPGCAAMTQGADKAMSDFDAAKKRLEKINTEHVFVAASGAVLGRDIRRALDEVERLRDNMDTVAQVSANTHKYCHRKHAEAKQRAEKAEAELAAERACHDCREYRAMMEAKLAAEREQRERLEKALREVEAFRLKNLNATCPDCEPGCDHGASADRIILMVREALRPAAPSAQHVEMDEGESCSCGWTSHTKAWRAHAAHMRRRGETTSENSLPLGHEFEPCPSLMPDGFPARFCVLKSPKQTECHFWHLHPAHYCGQPESAHRRKP